MVFNSNKDVLKRILLWKRFIDDVFLLFKGTKEECGEFVEWLNSLMPGVVKFKFEYSDVKIEFLDLQIFIGNKPTHQAQQPAIISGLFLQSPPAM